MDQMGTLNKCMNHHDDDQYNDDKYELHDNLDDDQDRHDHRVNDNYHHESMTILRTTEVRPVPAWRGHEAACTIREQVLKTSSVMINV